MTCTKEELKKRIESMPLASDGKVQFATELKRDVMEYSTEQQAMGRSQHNIAADLGMRGWTLNRWHQNERKARGGGAGFVEVVAKKRGRPPKVSVSVPAEAFEVTCPSGFGVRVPASFDAGALGRLLQTIEGR